MNADDRMRFAAGETDEMPPAPTGLPEREAVREDMAYSPASETETQQKQRDPLPDTVDADIDPDDAGDVDVDPGDLHLPGREDG